MHHLGRVILICLAVACFGLVVLAVRVPRRDVPHPAISTAPMVMHGFRSALYDADRLRLRVSGDFVSLSHSRVFGPFSLGFMYSLVGRNVTLETFARADAASEPAPHALSLDRIAALVGETWGSMQLGSAELGPVNVVEHRDGQTKEILYAGICRATLAARRVVCNDGVVDVDGSAVLFRELTYDGKTLRTR